MSVAMLDTMVEAPELLFEGGLPGFLEAHRFTLVSWGGDDSPFSLLRSLEYEGLEFVVVPPSVFFPSYEPEIDDATADRLGLTDPTDVILLVMLTLGERAIDATANLMGPIVINRHTRKACQAVLANSGYDLRAPLV